MNVIASRTFKCSDIKPDGPGVISASMVLVWHAGQGGRRIIMMLALDQAGALQNSQSPVDAGAGR